MDPQDLKDRINRLSRELEGLGPGPDDTPQFSVRANAIRRNAHLEQADAIKSQMISAYGDYCALLEGILESLLEVERDMTGIIRYQAERAG